MGKKKKKKRLNARRTGSRSRVSKLKDPERKHFLLSGRQPVHEHYRDLKCGDITAEEERMAALCQIRTTNRIKQAKLRSSRYVCLSNLRINALPQNFGVLKKICRLDLHNNNLFDKHGLFSTLKSFTDLYELDLSKNFLHGTLPQSCGRLTSLQKLSLANNKIVELPSEVGRWRRLETLSLATNGLRMIPSLAQEGWAQLKDLSLRDNSFTALPELKHWRALRRLDAADNRIAGEIPEAMGLLVHLERLDLSKNLLTAASPALRNCVRLRELRLTHNRFTAVPAAVIHLTALTVLSLSRNNIHQVPKDLSQLKELRIFSIARNKIRTLHPELFQGWKDLRELNISGNKALAGFPSTIGACKNVQAITAADCPGIKSLPQQITQLTGLLLLDVRVGSRSACKVSPELAFAMPVSCKMFGCKVTKKASRRRKPSSKRKVAVKPPRHFSAK